ncbi:NIL domain-containing protein [Nostocaceae cyanobacterium CENA357]|uniref:NIL domain-containing protein n=2 Tax=Atlanticothrix TaxID=2840441 RepID=A0A8J7L235_9CYAN|nr:NIL domain-containing protein [Atlanticothrix silvestris CENA357]
MAMVSFLFENNSITQLRVRLYIPQCYLHEPIISQMISRYKLTVNITGAKQGQNFHEQGYFDLELRGYTSHINHCLNYLESLNLKIIGKPNTDGDSWYY